MKVNTEIILKDFTSFISSFGIIYKPHLISFDFHLEYFDLLKIVEELSKYFDDIFLFRVPKNKRTLIGLNSALELIDLNEHTFISVSEKMKQWEKNFIHNQKEINFTFPDIICCTAKFDPEKSSELWSEFQSLRIYIPEFVIFNSGDKSTAIFNFILNAGEDGSTFSEKLINFLKIIENLRGEVSKAYEIKIISNSKSVKEEIINWKKTFNDASSFLKNGIVEKLVLARVHSFTIERLINWSQLLDKLYNRFNDCYLFFIKRKSSVFFGSSPEMFLKVIGKHAEVESVAGSAPRSKKSEADYQLERVLQSSKKNHQEHLFVSDFISDILINYSDNVRIIEEKQIRKLDNIQHLITRISAELNFKNNVFELIDSLFPTPAVCGVPKERAMSLIRNLETYDRGLYSGLIGLMNFDGSCEFAVSIRSALVKDNIVNAFAGAGLIKSSDSEEEFAETELKLNTVLSLFKNES